MRRAVEGVADLSARFVCNHNCRSNPSCASQANVAQVFCTQTLRILQVYATSAHVVLLFAARKLFH